MRGMMIRAKSKGKEKKENINVPCDAHSQGLLLTGEVERAKEAFDGGRWFRHGVRKACWL